MDHLPLSQSREEHGEHHDDGGCTHVDFVKFNCTFSFSCLIATHIVVHTSFSIRLAHEQREAGKSLM